MSSSDGSGDLDGEVLLNGELFVEPIELKCENVLSVKPAKYRFPVDLEKRISFVLQVTNKTDEYVAFKVRVTNSNYRAKPFRGIVLPRTTCDITVSILANGKSQDPLLEDMILLQSFIAPKGATGADITPEMFEDESDKVVEEFELRVLYVPADPPVPEGSWENISAWASCVENKIHNLYLADALYVPVLPKSSGVGSSARASGVENGSDLHVPLPPKSSGVGSSARAFGVENGNQKKFMLGHVTGTSMRHRGLQKILV